MSGKRGLGLVLAGVVLFGCASAGALAVSPLEKLFSLKRVEADPDKPYRLTQQHGPWMIMACSFSGKDAPEQAHDLVLELRKRYKIEAYVYRKTFDLRDQGSTRGVDQFGRPRPVRYRRGDQVDEVAVLVGNYRSVDDPEGQETLQKLKYFQPDCLRLERDKPTSRNLASWRLFWSQVSREKRKKGPMRYAMMTANPMLPEGYLAPKGVDPLVIEANRGVEHCLLDCPGKYTVQVATYTGRIAARQQEVPRLVKARFDRSNSKLVQAAENAHKMTKALRIKGYEAYEFHDRYASIVTVGSFDWHTRRLPNGRPEVNPAIQAVIDHFGPKQTNLGGQTGGLAVQTLIGIPFDMQPKAVHVPRRSISAELNRDVTSLF